MKKMRKKLAVAVTVALLAFPLSTALTMADTEILTTTAPATTTTDTTTPATAVLQAEAAVAAYEAGPITTLAEVATAEGLKAAADTAVAAVGDVALKTAFELRVTNRAAAIAPAKTALQADAAEAAVAAYEAGPIITLAEVATAEGLKAAADTAVAAVGDVALKTAFELRVTNRAAAIAPAKTALQAEAAVAAYEAGPITTLAEVATAEGLKAAADTAVAAVGDVAAKTAFELRITNRAAAIATAKTTAAPVVDANGNTVTSSTWFSSLVGKLQLALTFDPARKCELNERHALAKLAEAQKLMKEGNPEAAQICLNQYTDKIAKAQAFLDQVKDPTSETAKTLDKALVNVDSNNILVLSNLIDKLPPQAAQKLAINVVRSMEKAVTKIQKEEAKVAPVTTPVTESKILEKQAKVALEDFKKSLKQKGKIHLEDLEQQDNEDKKAVERSKPEREKPEVERNSQLITQNQTSQTQYNTLDQPTHKTQTGPNNRKSEQGTEERNKQEVHGDNKNGHKDDNHRDNK